MVDHHFPIISHSYTGVYPVIRVREKRGLVWYIYQYYHLQYIPIDCCNTGWPLYWSSNEREKEHLCYPDWLNLTKLINHLGMDQYLLIPFLGGWTSIYQLFWCSPGVPGFWLIATWLNPWISPWFHDDSMVIFSMATTWRNRVTGRPIPSSPQRITATERPSSSPRKVRIHSGPQTWWYAWRTKDWWRFFVGKVQKIKRKLRTLSLVIFSCFPKKPFAVKGDSCATGSLNHGKWIGSQPNIVISWNVSSQSFKTKDLADRMFGVMGYYTTHKIGYCTQWSKPVLMVNILKRFLCCT